jgi:small multidrug resistance pump
MNPGWRFIAMSITAEVVATYAMKHTDGMTRLVPTLFMLGAFTLSFWLFSIALRTMPLGLTYAVWAGGSTALVTALGVAVFGDRITIMSLVCILLIIAGIVGLHVANHSS